MGCTDITETVHSTYIYRSQRKNMNAEETTAHGLMCPVNTLMRYREAREHSPAWSPKSGHVVANVVIYRHAQLAVRFLCEGDVPLSNGAKTFSFEQADEKIVLHAISFAWQRRKSVVNYYCYYSRAEPFTIGMCLLRCEGRPLKENNKSLQSNRFLITQLIARLYVNY